MTHRFRPSCCPGLAARPSGLEHDVVKHALQWFSGLSESRMHALRFVTLAYAAVFAVEGIGLWMRRRWAEWLTTIITASLIPLEVWELFHRPQHRRGGGAGRQHRDRRVSVLARLRPAQDSRRLTVAGALPVMAGRPPRMDVWLCEMIFISDEFR